ncbi:MAG: GxxExxY protein [Verrucomicrobiales bacterium]|jgi:GxxExxY protein
MQLTKEELPHIIIGACMEVHKNLGIGMEADAYKNCLAIEFRMREVFFKRDQPLSFDYKGHSVDSAAILDFVVEDIVIISVVTVDQLLEAHRTTLTNYLRLTGIEIGLLVNFNAEKLRDGIKRLIVSSDQPQLHYKDRQE